MDCLIKIMYYEQVKVTRRTYNLIKDIYAEVRDKPRKKK